MTPAIRTILAALAASAAQAATADDGWFTTTGGVRVRTPAVAELDCAGLREVLGGIDRSGYRGATAAPVNSDDVTLLQYENRVSRRYYADCVNAAGALADGGGAFSHGFADEDEGARQ
jgi:hypothetical protein